MMHFGLYIPPLGEHSDARYMSELAHEAEECGWDGFFTWDSLLWSEPNTCAVADPWVLFAAAAMATTRIKLGPLVTAVARRRPWKLARETVTLDRLSNGRLIFGGGLGGDWCGEFSAFGERTDDRLHAQQLDEGLAVLTGLWSGVRFSYTGEHYQVRDVQFLPKPLQEPRIPIWIAGTWPHKRPFRRAAQWDGVFPLGPDRTLTIEQFTEMMAYIKAHRTSTAPFDAICLSVTDGTDANGDGDLVRPYLEAGATWWLEDFDLKLDRSPRERIRRGPPRV